MACQAGSRRVAQGPGQGPRQGVGREARIWDESGLIQSPGRMCHIDTGPPSPPRPAPPRPDTLAARLKCCPSRLQGDGDGDEQVSTYSPPPAGPAPPRLSPRTSHSLASLLYSLTSTTPFHTHLTRHLSYAVRFPSTLDQPPRGRVVESGKVRAGTGGRDRRHARARPAMAAGPGRRRRRRRGLLNLNPSRPSSKQ